MSVARHHIVNPTAELLLSHPLWSVCKESRALMKRVYGSRDQQASAVLQANAAASTGPTTFHHPAPAVCDVDHDNLTRVEQQLHEHSHQMTTFNHQWRRVQREILQAGRSADLNLIHPEDIPDLEAIMTLAARV